MAMTVEGFKHSQFQGSLESGPSIHIQIGGLRWAAVWSRVPQRGYIGAGQILYRHRQLRGAQGTLPAGKPACRRGAGGVLLASVATAARLVAQPHHGEHLVGVQQAPAARHSLLGEQQPQWHPPRRSLTSRRFSSSTCPTTTSSPVSCGVARRKASERLQWDRTLRWPSKPIDPAQTAASKSELHAHLQRTNHEKKKQKAQIHAQTTANMVSVLDYLGKLRVRQDELRTCYVIMRRCSAVNASRSPLTPPPSPLPLPTPPRRITRPSCLSSPVPMPGLRPASPPRHRPASEDGKALAGLRRINLDGLRWRVFDAKGQVLGRLASQIAVVLQGKDKPTYAPHVENGDMCVVLNAKDISVTGRKMTDKIYYWHTGYIGHLKERRLKDQMEKDPTEVIRKAVMRMLPRNRLRDDRDRKLRIFSGNEHPFHDRPLEPFMMPRRQVREMRPRARRALLRAQKKEQDRAAAASTKDEENAKNAKSEITA
uniref:50S ribosomal protein L13 n=1 Tax=Oryza barthii TaxID=65489 RepID=A0A0D3G4Y2_9ORYZ